MIGVGDSTYEYQRQLVNKLNIKLKLQILKSNG